MSNDIANANANAPVTVDVVLAQDKYEELLESHHLMVFLNDPKADVYLDHSQAYGHFTCEFTDPFTYQGGIEFGDSPRAALSAALRVIKRRRALREQEAAA